MSNEPRLELGLSLTGRCLSGTRTGLLITERNPERNFLSLPESGRVTGVLADDVNGRHGPVLGCLIKSILCVAARLCCLIDAITLPVKPERSGCERTGGCESITAG